MDSDYLAFPAEPQASSSKGDRRDRRQDDLKKRAQKRAPVPTGPPGSLLTPWDQLVRWDDCRDPAEQLHYEVMACVDYMSAQAEEHEVRRMVIEEIRRAIRKTVSTATVTPFGSFGTNMYLPEGKGYPTTLKLSIEDPQDLNNDVSGGSYEMPAIRKLFAAAFESLTSALLLRAQDIESRRYGRHVKFQKESSRSLLLSKKREHVCKIYYNGDLHKRLGEQRPKELPPIKLDPACMPGGRAPPPQDDEQGAADLEESKVVADAIFVAAESPEPDELSLLSQKSSKKRKSNELRTHATTIDADEEEESRYSIPKAKRRRLQEDLGGAGAQASVPDSSSSPFSGGAPTERKVSQSTIEKSDPSKAASRRAFWSAKGAEGIIDEGVVEEPGASDHDV
ncbi:hypothetical protein FRB90_004694 [Tulasnella sp. 427]|nr:hypothetical protein FRB90_004694 [Tulasnella sp. 427]